MLVSLSNVEGLISDPTVTHFWVENLCWDCAVGMMSRPHCLWVHTFHLQPLQLFPTASLSCTAGQEQAARQFLLIINSTIKNLPPDPSHLTAQTPFLTEFHGSNKVHPLVVGIKLLSREVQMENRTSWRKGVEFGIRGLCIRRQEAGWYILHTSIPTF